MALPIISVHCVIVFHQKFNIHGVCLAPAGTQSLVYENFGIAISTVIKKFSLSIGHYACFDSDRFRLARVEQCNLLNSISFVNPTVKREGCDLIA